MYLYNIQRKCVAWLCYPVSVCHKMCVWDNDDYLHWLATWPCERFFRKSFSMIASLMMVRDRKSLLCLVMLMSLETATLWPDTPCFFIRAVEERPALDSWKKVLRFLWRKYFLFYDFLQNDSFLRNIRRSKIFQDCVKHDIDLGVTELLHLHNLNEFLIWGGLNICR